MFSYKWIQSDWDWQAFFCKTWTEIAILKFQENCNGGGRVGRGFRAGSSISRSRSPKGVNVMPPRFSAAGMVRMKNHEKTGWVHLIWYPGQVLTAGCGETPGRARTFISDQLKEVSQDRRRRRKLHRCIQTAIDSARRDWSSARRDWRLFFQTFQPSFVISWPISTNEPSLESLKSQQSHGAIFCSRVAKGTNDSAVFKEGTHTFGSISPNPYMQRPDQFVQIKKINKRPDQFVGKGKSRYKVRRTKVQTSHWNKGQASTNVEGQKREWRLFIFISRESKWGTLQSAGNPRCAVPAEIHSICTDRPRPGSAAGLQVSPTSDTSQPVAILMNRPHWERT